MPVASCVLGVVPKDWHLRWVLFVHSWHITPAFYKLDFLFSRDQLWGMKTVSVKGFFSWEVWVLLWVWVRKGKETWLCHQIAPNLEQCLSWATGWRVCFTLGTCVKYISGFRDFFSSCVEALALICCDCSGCQPPKMDIYFPGIAHKTFRSPEDHRQKLRRLSYSSSVLRGWKHKGPDGILEETKSRPFCRCLHKHLKIWKPFPGCKLLLEFWMLGCLLTPDLQSLLVWIFSVVIAPLGVSNMFLTHTGDRRILSFLGCRGNLVSTYSAYHWLEWVHLTPHAQAFTVREGEIKEGRLWNLIQTTGFGVFAIEWAEALSLVEPSSLQVF